LNPEVGLFKDVHHHDVPTGDPNELIASPVDVCVPLDIAEDPPAVDKVKGTIFVREGDGVSTGNPNVRVEVAAGGPG
jgi:hypothetical protein